MRDEEVKKLSSVLSNSIVLARAVELTNTLVLENEFYDFLTTLAYPILNYLHDGAQITPKL